MSSEFLPFGGCAATLKKLCDPELLEDGGERIREGGEVASNRLEDQGVSVLALHLLQNFLVFVNTLMLQRVVSEPTWMKCMGAAVRRGLTPLAWGHANPYGAFHLDMSTRLPLDMPGLHADSSQLSFLSV